MVLLYYLHILNINKMKKVNIYTLIGAPAIFIAVALLVIYILNNEFRVI